MSDKLIKRFCIRILWMRSGEGVGVLCEQRFRVLFSSEILHKVARFHNYFFCIHSCDLLYFTSSYTWVPKSSQTMSRRHFPISIFENLTFWIGVFKNAKVSFRCPLLLSERRKTFKAHDNSFVLYFLQTNWIVESKWSHANS